MPWASFAVLLVIGFVIFNLMPSGPCRGPESRGHPTSAAQQAQRWRQQLGLNQSVIQQFGHFVSKYRCTAIFGYSWQFQQSVSSLVASRLWPTILLMGTSTLISIVLGMWLGIRSGWEAGQPAWT